MDQGGGAGEGAVREEQARVLQRGRHGRGEAVQHRGAGLRALREEGLPAVARHLPDGS